MRLPKVLTGVRVARNSLPLVRVITDINTVICIHWYNIVVFIFPVCFSFKLDFCVFSEVLSCSVLYLHFDDYILDIIIKGDTGAAWSYLHELLP